MSEFGGLWKHEITSTHLYPRRRNVAAKVAEEFKKTVTYATTPMDKRRKKDKKKVYIDFKLWSSSSTSTSLSLCTQVSHWQGITQSQKAAPAPNAISFLVFLSASAVPHGGKKSNTTMMAYLSWYRRHNAVTSTLGHRHDLPLSPQWGTADWN